MVDLDAADEEVLKNIRPLDQAAILLLSLGEGEAGEVLRHLSPKEVQNVGAAMTSLKEVDQKGVAAVVRKFALELTSVTGLGVDSDNYIRNMLVGALGEDKANGLIDRILMGGNTAGLDSLKWMEPRSVADLITNEHPQIQAIVIAYLDADHSAQVLALLDEPVRLEIMMRVAMLDSIHPNALQELNNILERQFSGQAGAHTQQMGGHKVAAEIMNNLDTTTEQSLMESIKQVDLDTGEKIQDLMFVFDDLVELEDRSIQTILKEVATDGLIIALKGATEPLKTKIFSNMSARAAELLKDDLEAKGPVKVSDVEQAQREILMVVRRLEESGEIVLGGAHEQMI